MGGSGKVREVQDRVGQIMKPILSDVDLQKVPSGQVRWRNTACWARQDMVDEGLLKTNSPRGIWEISEEGRASLESRRV